MRITNSKEIIAIIVGSELVVSKSRWMGDFFFIVMFTDVVVSQAYPPLILMSGLSSRQTIFSEFWMTNSKSRQIGFFLCIFQGWCSKWKETKILQSLVSVSVSSQTVCCAESMQHVSLNNLKVASMNLDTARFIHDNKHSTPALLLDRQRPYYVSVDNADNAYSTQLPTLSLVWKMCNVFFSWTCCRHFWRFVDPPRPRI